MEAIKDHGPNSELVALHSNVGAQYAAELAKEQGLMTVKMAMEAAMAKEPKNQVILL